MSGGSIPVTRPMRGSPAAPTAQHITGLIPDLWQRRCPSTRSLRQRCSVRSTRSNGSCPHLTRFSRCHLFATPLQLLAHHLPRAPHPSGHAARVGLIEVAQPRGVGQALQVRLLKPDGGEARHQSRQVGPPAAGAARVGALGRGEEDRGPGPADLAAVLVYGHGRAQAGSGRSPSGDASAALARPTPASAIAQKSRPLAMM